MENKNQTMLQRGITLLTVIIGNAMYAAVAVLFLLPSGLPTGGTTGIALLVNRLTGLSVSMFVLGFNIVMLVVGFIFLGKKFAFTTIVSTFILIQSAWSYSDRSLQMYISQTISG